MIESILITEMKRRQKKLDEYILSVLTNAGFKGDELTSHLIIWKQFFNHVKPAMSKLSYEELKHFAEQFLRFVIEFETICIRAYKPLSGSQSTAKDIIHMYSSRDIKSLK